MKKINILSQSVYNRIAAGEVVDRPYSAVKELVENSIDAGATEIEIYIENGGKQLIKVVDNGSGIDYDDMEAAFMPHATSKISGAEDLNYIETLGFRGEALASIAAISKVELMSKCENDEACIITCEGGKLSEILPAALQKGTVITVRDLFYNTPVRAKFLKSDKKEESDITSFVERFILGNPKISFKYFIDGKLALQSYGGGLEEAMAQVYGAKVLSQCYKIDAVKNSVRVSGFIGNQNFFKSNKSYQSIFLNGRYIVNNTIATAINNAYASYMMKRQFPFYVLNVTVPTDIVDVNVHPNKADVRFVDNKFIFSAVYGIISPILDGSARAADFVISETRVPEIKSTIGNRATENSVYGEPQLQSFPNSPQPDIVQEPQRKVFNPETDISLRDIFEEPVKPEISVTDDYISPDFSKVAANDVRKMLDKIEKQRIEFEQCRYKGNLFNTYLIYELRDAVYIIDQHAAHERLIYDKLQKKLKSRTVARQGLLFPYLFDTNAKEERFLLNNLMVLRNMGFSIEQFGVQSFRVDEVPVDLQDINLQDFFDDILADVDELKDIKLENILKDKFAMAACKHAIKGGMELTQDEVDALFKMLDGNMGLKCPHGRPVCVKLTKTQIEKMFKRIV